MNKACGPPTSDSNSNLISNMVRTKQTKSYGGEAPRKQLATKIARKSPTTSATRGVEMLQRHKPQTGDLKEIKSDLKSTKVENVEMSPLPGNWQNLPHFIFGELMTMIGRDSIQDFQKCRQVCRSWNTMTSQITKYDKATIERNSESLAAQIREKRANFKRALLPEITTAASLAHHGLLVSVQILIMRNVDLASVPVENLASLTSCVTGTVEVNNLRNCDIISILDHVECDLLDISNQSLSIEETRALVRVMESGVLMVWLGDWGDVRLDFRALTQYSGQGKCEDVIFYYDRAARNIEKLRCWAQRINWTLKVGADKDITISKLLDGDVQLVYLG